MPHNRRMGRMGLCGTSMSMDESAASVCGMGSTFDRCSIIAKRAFCSEANETAASHPNSSRSASETFTRDRAITRGSSRLLVRVA